MKTVPDNEIAVLTRAIYYIKRGWAGRCKKEDYEPECGECQARIAIDLMKKSIEFTKD